MIKINEYVNAISNSTNNNSIELNNINKPYIDCNNVFYCN